MFFKDADLILGVDTGPLHLAADALYDSDTAQIIGIYGPTSAKRSGPYSFDYLSYDEIYNTKASHKRTFKKDGGSMNKISPEKLFEKLLSIGFSR
jgi:ADP-heptose:LPS heptosyltransferase